MLRTMFPAVFTAGSVQNKACKDTSLRPRVCWHQHVRTTPSRRSRGVLLLQAPVLGEALWGVVAFRRLNGVSYVTLSTLGIVLYRRPRPVGRGLKLEFPDYPAAVWHCGAAEGVWAIASGKVAISQAPFVLYVNCGFLRHWLVLM